MLSSPKDVLHEIIKTAKELNLFRSIKVAPINLRDAALETDFPCLAIWKDNTINGLDMINRTNFTLEFSTLNTKTQHEMASQIDSITDLEMLAAILFEELRKKGIVDNPWQGNTPFYGAYNSGLTGFEVNYDFPIKKPCLNIP